MRDTERSSRCGGPAAAGRLGHLCRCVGLSVLLAALGLGGGLVSTVSDGRPSAQPGRPRLVISLWPVAPPDAAAARSGRVGLGVPVRDGQFRFVVRSVSCGARRVGGRFLDETAQGVFCEVAVSVRNVGRLPRAFDASDQVAYDARGRRYEGDLTAGLQANQGRVTFLAEILPGERIHRTLVFDVPAGVRLTAVRLHDSAFSNGVRVPLS